MNWRELPAGRGLDRIIAERLGYTVQFNENNGYYYLVRPDGTKAINYGTEWAAWEASPAFSVDANAAIALWDNDYHWAIFPDPDQPGKFCATHPCSRDYDVGIETADKPAEAISRSWLAWGDKTNGCSK
jgi:hypothetical protein